ncbi:hypothetical protein [Streptomyces sp. NPDC001774]
MTISIALGVLLGLVFGLLHRADLRSSSNPPNTNASYSAREALMRTGQGFIGTTVLAMATLTATPPAASILIALTAAICGLLYGALSHGHATTRAAIWKGALAFAGVSGAGHTLLAYWPGH